MTINNQTTSQVSYSGPNGRVELKLVPENGDWKVDEVTIKETGVK